MIRNNKINNQSVNNSIDDNDTPKRPYLIGSIGALFGIMPGIILWIILYLIDFFPAIMGFIIIGGALLGFQKTGATVNKLGALICLLIALTSIAIAECSLEARSLRIDYKNTVTEESSEEIKEIFIESFKTSGLTDEDINNRLKEKYNINGLEDTDGLNQLSKEMQDNSYMSEHNLTKVPDSFINSYLCLNDYTETSSINSKDFYSDLLIGFAFTLLGFVTIYNSTFMNPKIY